MTPLFKNKLEKKSWLNWTVSNFPENYTKLDFLDPLSDTGGILFAKSPHEETLEAINYYYKDNLFKIFRKIRDEKDEFIKELKKIKFNETNFKFLLKEDKINEINEFFLRIMSKNGSKESYSHTSLAEIIKSVKAASKRLENTRIFNKNPIYVINAFDKEDTFIYCNMTFIEEENSIRTKFINSLLNFRGKVMISDFPPKSVKPYKEFKCIKNKEATDLHPRLYINY